MCVVSMVMDHYRERWTNPPFVYPPVIPLSQIVNPPTQDEIDEFRRLLDRARKYDKKYGEPDCELDEKRLALKKIANEMGIDISFVDDKEAP